MFTLIQLLILVGIALVIGYFIWACKSPKIKNNEINIQNDTNTNTDENNQTTTLPLDSDIITLKYLIVFTAPWCGYCQQFYPTIDQLIEKYKDSDKIKIVPINKDENAKLAELHNIEMIPAVKLCMNGLENPQDTVEYKGDRSLQDLIIFIEKYI